MLSVQVMCYVCLRGENLRGTNASYNYGVLKGGEESQGEPMLSVQVMCYVCLRGENLRGTNASYNYGVLKGGGVSGGTNA